MKRVIFLVFLVLGNFIIAQQKELIELYYNRGKEDLLTAIREFPNCLQFFYCVNDSTVISEITDQELFDTSIGFINSATRNFYYVLEKDKRHWQTWQQFGVMFYFLWEWDVAKFINYEIDGGNELSKQMKNDQLKIYDLRAYECFKNSLEINPDSKDTNYFFGNLLQEAAAKVKNKKDRENRMLEGESYYNKAGPVPEKNIDNREEADLNLNLFINKIYGSGRQYDDCSSTSLPAPSQDIPQNPQKDFRAPKIYKPPSVSDYSSEPSSPEIYKITSSSLNLRNCPSVNCELQGTIRGGEEVEVLSKTTADWWRIRYGEYRGYVSSKFLSVKLDTYPRQRPLTQDNLQGYVPTNIVTGNLVCSNIIPKYDYANDAELNIKNKGTADLVVKLMNRTAEVAYRIVYVRAGESVKINNIPQGFYYLKYGAGTGWMQKIENNKCLGKFNNDIGYWYYQDKKYPEMFDFNVTKKVNGNYIETSVPAYDLELGIIYTTSGVSNLEQGKISNEEFNK